LYSLRSGKLQAQSHRLQNSSFETTPDKRRLSQSASSARTGAKEKASAESGLTFFTRTKQGGPA
jgi:hypothetical protein